MTDNLELRNQVKNKICKVHSCRSLVSPKGPQEYIGETRKSFTVPKLQDIFIRPLF